MRLYTEEEKQKQIKKEITKLRRLFKNLPKDKQKAAEGLSEAAFRRPPWKKPVQHRPGRYLGTL